MTDQPQVQNIYQQAGTQQADFYKWGLDIEDITVTIEHNLRGEFYDNNSRTWVKKGKILMNNDGVDYVSTVIRSRLGRHIAMSDLTIEQIHRMALEICEEVCNVLENNWRDFAVDIIYLDTIVNLIDHVCYTTLCRAKDGGEKLFIKDIAPKENITTDSNKGSFLPIPFFGGGK
jgi:hypothetical protein